MFLPSLSATVATASERTAPATTGRHTATTDSVAVVIERTIHVNDRGDTARLVETRDRWRTRHTVDTLWRVRTDTFTVYISRTDSLARTTTAPSYGSSGRSLLDSVLLCCALLAIIGAAMAVGRRLR